MSAVRRLATSAPRLGPRSLRRRRESSRRRDKTTWRRHGNRWASGDHARCALHRKWRHRNFARRRKHGARHRATAKFFAASNDLFRREHHLWFEIEADGSIVSNFVEGEVVAEEVERRDLPPRSGNRLIDGERFVARLHEADFARAIVSEVHRARSGADTLIVDKHHRAGRIATNVEPTPHATRSRRQNKHHEQQLYEPRLDDDRTS
jgi:hypothetical protein